MARSQLEVADSLSISLKNINKSIDLLVGPFYEYVINPISNEISSAEGKADTLKRFYSDQFINVATPEEAAAFAINFGLSSDVGGYSKCTVTFFRNSAPPTGAIYTIAVGVLIGTQDSTLIYRVTTAKTMYGDYASTYYNPQTNRYEIDVIVEAVAPGIKYNVPAQRINKIISQSTNFDGLDQKAQALGGTEPEDSSSLTQRIMDKFKGLDINSITGISNTAKNYLPTQTVNGIRVIRPTDRKEFRRPTTKASLDIYVRGTQSFNFSEEYLALGGETSVPIVQNKTAYAIQTININGVALDSSLWSFVEDSSPEYRKSTKASSIIQLVDALVTNDIVEIIGTRNALLDSLQAVYTPTDTSLFEVDMLVRSFIDMPVVLSVEIKISNVYTSDLTSLEQGINDTIQYIVESPNDIYDKLTPESFKIQLGEYFPEAESIKIIEFRRQYDSIDIVEAIIPLKNQTPVYNSSASSVVVKV